MIWFAVYQVATGALHSVGTVVADPLPAEFAAKELGPEQPSGDWNATLLVYQAPVATTPPMAPLDFMRRFTVAEEAAIRTLARTDAVIEVFLSRLSAATLVHLDNQETIDGVNYCLSKGCITSDRASVILNG